MPDTTLTLSLTLITYAFTDGVTAQRLSLETGAKLFAMFDKGRVRITGTPEAVAAMLQRIDQLMVRPERIARTKGAI